MIFKQWHTPTVRRSKAKPQLVRFAEHVLSVFKEDASAQRYWPDASRRPALAVGHCAPQNLRLRRASFFFRGSSKYGGFAAAKPRLLCPFSDTRSPFYPRIERIRSSPLEKLSPKSFSNDHIDSPPGEHYLRPVMNTADVRFLPVRSFVVPIVPGATQTRERACHCLAARSTANFDEEVCCFYLNDSPSLLPLKHRVTDAAPPDQGRQQKTFPD